MTHLLSGRNRRTAKFRGGALALGLLLAAGAWAAGEQIKPGWNLFSKEQDVALGQEAAGEIEKEVEIANDRRLTSYVDSIGQRLAKVSQDPEYPFTFKVVAEPSINAFALPGGPIYIHSGLITAADNEAQVAGVMAHEVGHVVLRHSTNRASKQSVFQLPALIAGGLLNKKGGMLAALGQVGLGLGLNSVLLQYSRSAEKDADIVGARMMAKAGYNPIQMAEFFRKLEEAGGGRQPQFFSDHPNPGNRVAYVTEEISDYRSGNYVTNTRAFGEMKSRAGKIVPRKKPDQAAAQPAAPGQPQGVDSKGVYASKDYELRVPGYWRTHEASAGSAATIVPTNGVVKNSKGTSAIARGIMVGVYDDGGDVRSATSSLIENLQAGNPGLQTVRGERKSIRLDGEQGESVFLQGVSPVAKQSEYVWLITAATDTGLFYMAMISPESEYERLYPEFEKAVNSVSFR